MKLKEISKWKTCLLKDRKTKLPSKPGLYAVLDRRRQILYIGKSRNLLQRWSSGHHRYVQASKLRNCRLAYVTVRESLIHELEQYLIKQHKPIWNNTSVPVGKPGMFGKLFSWKELIIVSVISIAVGLAISHKAQTVDWVNEIDNTNQFE